MILPVHCLHVDHGSKLGVDVFALPRDQAKRRRLGHSLAKIHAMFARLPSPGTSREMAAKKHLVEWVFSVFFLSRRSQMLL